MTSGADKTARKPRIRKRVKRRVGRPAKKTGAAEVRRRERIAAIMALRLQGWSLEAIGDAQEPRISSQRVHKIIADHLANTATMATEQVRMIEVRRLDEMQIKVFESALTGDLLAIDRMVKIMAQRDSLLGLSAPTQVRMAGKDGGPIESRVVIEDAAAEVKRKLADAIAKAGRRGVSGEPDDDGSGGAPV